MPKHMYSSETGGFYIEGVHNNIPVDAVNIPVEEHKRLLNEQGNGKIIQPDQNGYPVAVEPPPPPEPTEEEKAQQRIKEIQSLLTANDLASVRPLRAKLAGTATEADDARLAELEEQAQALRAELVTLNAVV